MIEKIVVRGPVPQFYEITLRSDEDQRLASEAPYLSAALLDEVAESLGEGSSLSREDGSETSFSRDDAVSMLVKQYAEAEAVSDLAYSVRLMSVPETRKMLLPHVCRAKWDEVMNTPPLKQISKTLLEGAMMQAQLQSSRRTREELKI